MRSILISFLVIWLTGCGQLGPSITAAGIITEYVYDRSLLSYAAEFFDKKCENYTIYEQPPRCRRP